MLAINHTASYGLVGFFGDIISNATQCSKMEVGRLADTVDQLIKGLLLSTITAKVRTLREGVKLTSPRSMTSNDCH